MSCRLEHLKVTKDRLMAWMMHDVGNESGVHDFVERGYKNVSKACQVMAENEEEEGEKDDGS